MHEADLELARQCAAGDERAWERFVGEYRPLLYRAADALAPSGAAREIADSLYADLYGLRDGASERRSLFHYFHGRSSLATWLRAVLVQRFVDRARAGRKLEPLSERDVAARDGEPPDPQRSRYVALVREALHRAAAGLSARDRLRLSCYYVQELTLAETGRLMKESEATTSRQLARTRRSIRDAVEEHLREAGLTNDQIAACIASVADDPGPLDLKQVIYE
jgi:RNA polymerase sigma factor (sigma-70 family)